MADGVDFYDVQAMVEKAVSEERYARIRHIEETERGLRGAIAAERTDREEADDALQRTLDARTESRV